MAEDQTDSVAALMKTPWSFTAAEQNLQAPGVSTITADEIKNLPLAMCRKSSCRALT
jgi:outer membrane receptor for ferrienterochelin and colicin